MLSSLEFSEYHFEKKIFFKKLIFGVIMTSKRADFCRFLAILAIFQVFIISICFIAIRAVDTYEAVEAVPHPF